ncbi:hypothetical protein AHAS_Ahas02G0168100 [Arachis hypogaea]
MWRAHIRGLLLFSTLVTGMVALADVQWRDDDETPPPLDDDDKEVTIPWGGWVNERPPPGGRSRDRVTVEAAGPSPSIAAAPSSSAATASLPPPPAPEPTYLLLQHLLCFLEHLERRLMRRIDCLDQAFTSQGIKLSPLPDSLASDEQDQEEEHGDEPTQQDAPTEAQTTTETQQPPEDSQPTPPPIHSLRMSHSPAR